MNFQTGLLGSDKRTYLQHVCLKDGAVLAVEVQRVVLKEGTAGGQALVHHPYGTVEGGLPVAFGTETVTFGHQALRCQSRNLVEVAAVGLAQVVEVGGEAFGSLSLQDGTQGEFGLGGVPNFLIGFGTSVFQCGVVVVEAEVFVYQCLHVFILHLCVVFHQLAHGAVVHVVAHALLGLHLVAVGHSHVVHLIAEADDEHVLSIGPSGADAHPHGNLLLRFLFLPVAYHHFAADAHAGADVSELTVAVGTLVEVHEVHIHGIPRNFLVVLRVQVE